MIIYKATNLINSKIYIGQTVQSLKKRAAGHINKSLRQNIEELTAFHAAIRKHGPENFKFEIIYECSSMDELNKMEIFYITQFNSFKGHGYNESEGGRGSVGYRHTNKAKALLSKASLGRIQSKKTLDKKSKTIKGLYQNPEFKAKVTKSIQEAFNNKIYQYDKELNFIKLWPSMHLAKQNGLRNRFKDRSIILSGEFIWSKIELSKTQANIKIVKSYIEYLKKYRTNPSDEWRKEHSKKIKKSLGNKY